MVEVSVEHSVTNCHTVFHSGEEFTQVPVDTKISPLKRTLSPKLYVLVALQATTVLQSVEAAFAVRTITASNKIEYFMIFFFFSKNF